MSEQAVRTGFAGERRRAAGPEEGPAGGAGADQAECARAREAALRLLAQRARSVSEVRRALEERGFARICVDETVDWLVSLGYLDDRTYAFDRAESLRRKKPAGKALIARELEVRGVGRDIVDEVLAGISDGDECRAAFQAAWRELERMRALEPGRAVRRLEARLLRRGFDPDTVAKVLSEVLLELAQRQDRGR